MRIRVEPELRQQFIEVCRAQDLTAAQVLRAFMRNFVNRRGGTAQPDLFDLYPTRDVEPEYGGRR